jgi:Ser/Thr protein kinase RdoA (MazF antagonist)
MESFETLSRRGQLIRLGRLARAALQQYPLEIVRLASMKHEHNTTFRLWTADGGRYVMRVHRLGQHTVEAIHSELLWLAALQRDTNLDVPQPILTRAGELLTIAAIDGVPEPRVCVLFRWMGGRFLDKQLTAGHLEQIGRFTAQLHEHTAHWPLPADFVRGRVDVLTAEARRSSRVHPRTTSLADLENHPADEDVERSLRLIHELLSPDAADFVARAVRQIRQALKSLGYTQDTFGLIHADLHQENYFFHQNRMRVIDFDDCGFGHYLFDLNVTLIEVHRFPQYEALRAGLLKGYRSGRTLDPAHEAYLDSFFALRCLQLLMWVLESREHPTFRDQWEDWAQDELQYVRHFLGEMNETRI